MGVDITFTLDHNLKNISMEAVSRRLSPLHDLFVEMARYWSQWHPHLWPPLESWHDSGASDQGQPYYQAPAGFSVNFGTAAVQFHHICRFHHFIREMNTRTPLRHFARRSCELLGSDHVIYAPDEGVGEKILELVINGKTSTEIETKLLQLSPPASSFEELESRQRPPWTKPAYYVDTFQDISTTAVQA